MKRKDHPVYVSRYAVVCLERGNVWLMLRRSGDDVSGDLVVGVQDHRRNRSLLSERERLNPFDSYWHAGPWCLSIERRRKRRLVRLAAKEANRT